jgi:glycosyltransferase involved in cell wall biosynthesis
MKTQKPEPISAVVLTLNSERTLSRTLDSLKWCDEVVVVDSGSTDQTLEIAKRYGAQIHLKQMEGFGAQKQFGVNQATNDWVMIIDSDEVVTSELQREIQGLTFEKVGYELPRQLIFLGKLMHYSGTADSPLRLFDRRKGALTPDRVHESVRVEGEVARLHAILEHHSYLSLEDYFEKFNRYTTLAAQAMWERGERVSGLARWVSFPAHFVKRYVLQLGFLDGYHGFLWSLLSAIYPTVKVGKLELLRRTRSE